MEPNVRSLITALHAAPGRFVLALTGGGTSAAGWLLSVPGGSRTILEVVVPYAEQALTDFLGRRPSSFCSTETSRAMAERALERARRLAPGERVAGVGCTASLRSDRPKRGDHRFHLALCTERGTIIRSLTLVKEARTREQEEDVLDRVLLNVLAESAALAERVPLPLLAGEELHAETLPAESKLGAFLAGHGAALCVEPDGRMHTDGGPVGVLLPGSFNPLHAGHCGLAEVAERLVGRPAAFELSIINADKPALADEEVRRRLAAADWQAPVWLTRAPTFAAKAVLFPGAVFVVGADTAARIVAPRFYGDSVERMSAALGELRAHGCRFLVAGRLDPTGRFTDLDALDLPATHRDLFAAISADVFRMDVSSTELRARQDAPP